MRTTKAVADCYRCEQDIYDELEAHPLIDGNGLLYGYHCENCAEGVFEAYMQGIWE